MANPSSYDNLELVKGSGTILRYNSPNLTSGYYAGIDRDRNSLRWFPAENGSDGWVETQPDGFRLIYGHLNHGSGSGHRSGSGSGSIHRTYPVGCCPGTSMPDEFTLSVRGTLTHDTDFMMQAHADDRGKSIPPEWASGLNLCMFQDWAEGGYVGFMIPGVGYAPLWVSDLYEDFSVTCVVNGYANHNPDRCPFRTTTKHDFFYFAMMIWDCQFILFQVQRTTERYQYFGGPGCDAPIDQTVVSWYPSKERNNGCGLGYASYGYYTGALTGYPSQIGDPVVINPWTGTPDYSCGLRVCSPLHFKSPLAGYYIPPGSADLGKVWTSATCSQLGDYSFIVPGPYEPWATCLSGIMTGPYYEINL